jgi:oligogalacturonide lyase
MLKLSRRSALGLCGGGLYSAANTLPAVWRRFADGATEVELVRMTDPAWETRLPPPANSCCSSRSNFLLCVTNRTGSEMVARIDTKNGQMQMLGEGSALRVDTLLLSPDEKSYFIVDGEKLLQGGSGGGALKTVFESKAMMKAISLSTDGRMAAIAQNTNGKGQIVLQPLPAGASQVLLESPEEIVELQVRPGRAGLIYRRADGSVWIASFDKREHRRLKLAEAQNIALLWARDTKTLLYLSRPEVGRNTTELREHLPDENRDVKLGLTSAYTQFATNADASVILASSGSKAQPHMLLMLRRIRRELILCEHKSSNPAALQPHFSPSSQRIFFQSDMHGKTAIYTMAVDRLVEKTEAGS